MVIRPIFKIAAAVTFLSAGSEGLYRVWQNEGVDKYISSTGITDLKKTSRNPQMVEFMQSLDENKPKLKSILNLSEEQYEHYRRLAIGIAKEETNFGLDYKSTAKKYCTELCRAFKCDAMSEGLTNIKIENITKANGEEAKMLKQFGVTDITNPRMAAVATIVHIDFLKKKYVTYMQKIGCHQKMPLTPDEHLLVLWNGLRVDTTDKSIRAKAESVMNIILNDRNNPAPKGYVGKILHSIKK